MKTILLLHGAIGASDQLIPLKEKLSQQFDVHVLNFSGHGGTPFSEKAFSIKTFADEVLGYIDAHGLQQVSIFGYSMGGYVGMYIAKNHPGKIDNLITLATKFHWDETTALKETSMLDADKISQKIPAFAETLAKRHYPNDWKLVLQKTKDMLHKMGSDNPLKPEDYTTIELPVTILIGDRDKMVTLEETLLVYKSLPHAQMGILPNSHHPIEQTDIETLAFLITKFMK
jgi:pimeloyl-ACP methyl ester carboxylesterase